MAYCPEVGKCFAKRNSPRQPGCSLLNRTEFSKSNGHEGHCPFQKAEKAITNGRFYPYVDPGLR